MYRRIRVVFVVAVGLILCVTNSSAGEDGITISKPVIRESKSDVAAGYVVIQNNTKKDDRLIAVKSEIASDIVLHDTKIEDGNVKMIHLHHGIPIPAGETVKLMPRHKHIMLMEVSQPLKNGEEYEMILVFLNEGEISVTFDVRTIAETIKHNHDH